MVEESQDVCDHCSERFPKGQGATFGTAVFDGYYHLWPKALAGKPRHHRFDQKITCKSCHLLHGSFAIDPTRAAQ